MTPVQGHCDPRFAGVRAVFERHFADGEELGAAVAVFHEGRAVVDLWGGVADRHTGRPWEAGTPALAYSCTKAVTATALLLLAERGQVDVRAPVADCWPEFAARGKGGITVEHLLTHQAGLPVLEESVPAEEFEDQPAIAARLAAQAPLWEPGTAHGYHAVTYGFLVGEVIRRVSGKSAGEIVAADIAGPLGLELWLGAPPEVAGRAARLSAGDRVPPAAAPSGTQAQPPVSEAAPETPASPGQEVARAMADPGSLLNRALASPPVQRLKGGANNPVMLRAGWPALGMVATARGLAAFYRELIAGRVLRPATLRDATRRRVSGPDRVLLFDSSFGLGYMRPATTFLTPRPGAATAFGHTGYGGSLGLGDPEHGLAMAYIPNRLSNAVAGNLRAYHLAEAAYAAL
ncbi:CubicO group peptidase (beta-lactamase class C family) [Thermocatellispora tengchongensis]|uniref:CubicO group peptidase (Beta-lactamase class C family) n=1 Tax=Thermocatellispora tengchongensis TaxID=1073253 RepID=A0A840NWQ3_9ACTN|nr:serine hydrolase domain-containing protein [Thermocatellispora tengchongensis]MBB5133264.1 CubicO group peptidase (beta-lactamase class C family) [Thermocatellispora tengchongensis]